MQTSKVFQKRSFAFSLSNDSETSNPMCETKKLKTSTSELRKQAERVLQNHMDSKIQLTKSTKLLESKKQQFKAAQHVVYSLKTQNSSLIEKNALMDSRINSLDDVLSQLEKRYERVKASVLQCIQYSNHIEKTRQTISSVDSLLSLKNDKYQEKLNSYKYKVDSIKTSLETLKEKYLMSNEDIKGKLEVNSVYETDIMNYNRIISENTDKIQFLEREIQIMTNTLSNYEYKLKEYQNENINLKTEYKSLNNTLMNENKRIIEDENTKQLQLSAGNEYIQKMEIQSNNNMNKIQSLENEMNKTQKQLLSDENDNNMLLEKKIQLTNVNGMLNEELRVYDNKVNEMRQIINENEMKLNQFKEQETMMSIENESMILKINELTKEIEKQQMENENVLNILTEIENNERLLDNNILIIEQQIENKILENNKQEEMKTTLYKEEQCFSELIEYKNQLTADINEMKRIKQKQEKEKEKNQMKSLEYNKLNEEKERIEKEIIENEEILKAKSNELKLLNEEISNLNIQINEIAKKCSNNKNDDDCGEEMVIELTEEMKLEIERKVENDMKSIEEEHIRKCKVIEDTGAKMREEIQRGYNERARNRIKLIQQQYEMKKKKKEEEEEDKLLLKKESIGKMGIYNTNKSVRIYRKQPIVKQPTIEETSKTEEKRQFRSSIQKTRRKTKKSTVSSITKNEVEANDTDWFNDDIFTFN